MYYNNKKEFLSSFVNNASELELVSESIDLSLIIDVKAINAYKDYIGKYITKHCEYCYISDYIVLTNGNTRCKRFRFSFNDSSSHDKVFNAFNSLKVYLDGKLKKECCFII